MTIVLSVPTAATDTSLQKLERDLVVVDGATLFVYDLAKAYSFPRQGNPVAGDTIKDLTFGDHHASWRNSPTESAGATFAGGGFDFSAGAAGAHDIALPAGFMTQINANQQWLFALYMKMPTADDFTNMPTGLKTFVEFNGGTSLDAAGGGLLQYVFSGNGTTRMIYMFRGTSAVGNFEQANIGATDLDPFMGQVVQIAMYRTATGVVGQRIKSATNVKALASAAGTPLNTTNLATRDGGMGLARINPALGTGRKFRIYRAFLEDLHVSGRDPLAVLDADWARNSARFT